MTASSLDAAKQKGQTRVPPAHQTKHQQSPPCAGFVVSGLNVPPPSPTTTSPHSQTTPSFPRSSVKSLSIVRTFLETPSRLRLVYPLASLDPSLHITVTGFSSPQSIRRTAPPSTWRFFWAPLYGGRAQGTFGCAGFLIDRYC